ncbi:MAG: SAM-dependent methyltransferase [Acidobacteriota bacterium]
MSAVRQRGIGFLAAKALEYGVGVLAWQYHERCRPARWFTLQGRRYRCFYGLYNLTWKNEREVEIAVAAEAVESTPAGRILEVGNVLSWYMPVAHDVVDKYERGAGVINADVVDLDPGRLYELVVSISTLEHVGWDEHPRDPEKVVRAVARLKGLLAPGGRLLVTAPLGYNPGFDALLEGSQLGFDRLSFLRRDDRTQQWSEIEAQAAFAAAVRDPSRKPPVVAIASCDAGS